MGALWASKPANRPPRKDERFYWLLTVAGAVLLALNYRTGRLSLEWTNPDWMEWVLVVVAALGLAFTWWARIHLGTLWSGRVTRKADHRIIDTGPYRYVRHPIYTGILVAIWASALVRPGPLGIAGAALLTVSFVIKLRLEERFLMQELGAAAYEGYRRRVPMLVPFWPVQG
jgi:protein-S-isoprenylcysteine O-methyltransferase Ste14